MKVLYNGENIEVCAGQEACPFSAFEALQKDLYVPDFQAQCQGSSFSLAQLALPTLVNTVLFLLVLVMFVFVIKLGLKLRKMEGESNGF